VSDVIEEAGNMGQATVGWSWLDAGLRAGPVIPRRLVASSAHWARLTTSKTNTRPVKRWAERIRASTHVTASVTDFRTLFSVHCSGSPRSDQSTSVTSMYLVCGHLSSSTKRQALAARMPLVTLTATSQVRLYFENLPKYLGKPLCGRLPDCKQFHDFDWQV
jgi:hypothetical protein